MVLRRDSRGALVGHIYFFNGWGSGRGRDQEAAIALLRDHALRASSPGLPEANVSEALWQGKAGIESAWRAEANKAQRGQATPSFGRATITLIRTGQCIVEVDPRDLFTTRTIRLAQLGGKHEALWTSRADEIFEECRSVAEQCFFVVRDLTHQHYHHHKSSDLLTTVTPWGQSNDEDWRRETQYGLMRMAIALRRLDTAEAYRQALGVVAYADAFQKHLCGWYSTTSGIAASSAVRFQYDFAPLRASIEASLKVRELKDSNLRARLFFSFGTLVTALTVVVPAYRGAAPTLDGVPGWDQAWVTSLSGAFGGLVSLAVAYPWFALFSAMMIGFAVDYVFVGLAVKSSNYSQTRASTSRLLGGLMAWLRRHRVPVFFTQGLISLGLATLIAAMGGIMFLCGWVLFSQIGSS